LGLPFTISPSQLAFPLLPPYTCATTHFIGSTYPRIYPRLPTCPLDWFPFLLNATPILCLPPPLVLPRHRCAMVDGCYRFNILLYTPGSIPTYSCLPSAFVVSSPPTLVPGWSSPAITTCLTILPSYYYLVCPLCFSPTYRFFHLSSYSLVGYAFAYGCRVVLYRAPTLTQREERFVERG